MTTPVVTREWQITYLGARVASVAAAGGGNTAYTMEADQPINWMEANVPVAVFGCTNAANNGTFLVVSVAGLVVTLANAGGVVEAGSPGEMGIPVGGTSEYHLHHKVTHEDTYPTEVFRFNAVVMESVETTFNALVRAIDQAFRTPRGRFRVVQNGVSIHDRNPNNESGGNTGFNADPVIHRPDSDWNTGRSRMWEIEVRIGRPADLAGQNGRQSTINDFMLDTANIKSLIVTGIYTALGANGSRAQHDANVETYCSAVKASLGGTYELFAASAATDDADKICNFRREYHEVIYNQSAGVLDNASIKEGSYSYRRGQVAPGDSQFDVRRLESLTASFSCVVDRLVTTDLKALWENTIKPYISSEVRRIMNSNDAGLISKTLDVNQKTNMISGEVDFLVVAEGSADILESDIVRETLWDKGKLLVGAWDGNPLAKHVYDSLNSKVRTTTIRQLRLGERSEVDEFADSFRWQTGGNYVVMTDRPAVRARWIGIPPDQIQCSEVFRVIVEEYAETPSGADPVPPAPVASA